MEGYIRLPLCINNSLCLYPVTAISSLFSPSSVCWCLNTLNRGPRSAKMHCESCKGSIHE
uniref:Uncharacterized protein n=1 Tax=Arundo donax TaxID=35708 RepID=A0A0A9A1T7_ARUDO